MEQTKKLYDQDAYATEFDAEVVSCEEKMLDEKTVYSVILDQTRFFPEEGGQSPDQGTINQIEVIDVQIQNGIITHTLNAPLNKGSMVHGKVDWKHRFYNMQQHSGEHIFSGLVHKNYGYDNVGFHLSDQIVTMDFSGVLSMEQALEIELAANEAITKNLDILVTYPSKEELAVLDYRSKIEIDGQVRIVTIPGVDVCACCAPHVKKTGEIGLLKIMSLQNYKGGVRISILCGFRALEDYKKRVLAMTEVSNLLSISQDILPEAVMKLKNMNQALKSEVNAARQDYMDAKIAKIDPSQKNVLLFEKELETPVIRNAVNRLVQEHNGICGIFSGNDESGFQFIIGSSTVDVRVIMNGLKEKLNARGGGSKAMIQGSVASEENEIHDILDQLL